MLLGLHLAPTRDLIRGTVVEVYFVVNQCRPNGPFRPTVLESKLKERHSSDALARRFHLRLLLWQIDPEIDVAAQVVSQTLVGSIDLSLAIWELDCPISAAIPHELP